MSSFRNIWILCSVVLLLGSYIFAAFKEIEAFQHYVYEQWNVYLKANYPLPKKICIYGLISKEEERLVKILEAEYAHKMWEFRAEYEDSYAGNYILMFVILNIVANLAVYAGYSFVYRAQ